MAESIVEKLIVNFSNGPDYLSKVGVLAEEAKAARDEAKESANSAVNAANVAAQQAYEASISASSANNSAIEAKSYATDAGIYTGTAKTYADSAKAYSDTAAANAAAASESAQQADNLAQGVGTMVERAENAVGAIAAYSVPPWDASTAYSYPTVVSYTDGNTYRCIGNNVPAGTTPDTSQEWVRITMLGGDDYFDIDLQGSLMPAVNPTFAYNWVLDANGCIMPRDASDPVVTPVNSYAEEALKTANAALARANTIIYEGIPVELDSNGNVTTTNDTL